MVLNNYDISRENDLRNPRYKIAFLILAHADPVHLSKLVAALSPHDVYIHWDLKSGLPPFIPEAVFVSYRKAVFWAGFSVVEATISLIKEALRREPSKLVLLSGSCFPIRPMKDLEDLFAKDNGKNYINAVEVDQSDHLRGLVSRWCYKDGIFPDFVKRTKSILGLERFIRAALNTGMAIFPHRRPKEKLYHGSQFWAVTPELAEVFVQNFERNRDLVSFYRRTFASDEQFFQTVARNSEHSSSCGIATPFTKRGVFLTANLHIIDPSLAKWFGESPSDFSVINNSDKYFVRKIRSGKGDAFVDRISKDIFGK
ncbi:hypothetical protein CDV52_09195 [Haematobacter missouriensis]|uniref:Peptide O-xylosyltransferase n=1 Tax=Haematobacter missouriensis TaxID=366616 RepID=A0A212ARA9_9RHOB|nr:beta-1,6-N-acetylglucosaminyltransferase [Haematobacter missouriensis]OWJ84057.1 hypothetical protein CDV52_09195 [Haematobacter missouriensis]